GSPRRRDVASSPTRRSSDLRAAVVRLDELAADGARPIDEMLVEPPAGDEPLPAVHSTMGSDLYGRAVEVAREHILAGDIFQVVRSEEHTSELQSRENLVCRL